MLTMLITADVHRVNNTEVDGSGFFPEERSEVTVEIQRDSGEARPIGVRPNDR